MSYEDANRSSEDERTWQLAARCRGVDPDLFFHPEDERGKARRARQVRAKQICMACPVLDQCRAYSLRGREAFGVWGGISEEERRTVLSRSVVDLVMATSTRVMTRDTFEPTAAAWDVDNNAWVVGVRRTSAFDATHTARPIIDTVAGRNVIAVICTDGHHDHIAGARVWGTILGAPVLLHPVDELLWRMTPPTRRRQTRRRW